jgi:hypothetical protein
MPARILLLSLFLVAVAAASPAGAQISECRRLTDVGEESSFKLVRCLREMDKRLTETEAALVGATLENGNLWREIDFLRSEICAQSSVVAQLHGLKEVDCKPPARRPASKR